jgi:hypothetical protein
MAAMSGKDICFGNAAIVHYVVASAILVGDIPTTSAAFSLPGKVTYRHSIT